MENYLFDHIIESRRFERLIKNLYWSIFDDHAVIMLSAIHICILFYDDILYFIFCIYAKLDAYFLLKDAILYCYNDCY